MESRRSYLRAKISSDATLHDIDGDLLFPFTDISQGGAFLRSDILFEDGEEITVSFSLPNYPKRITAVAVISRTTKAKHDNEENPGMGLFFKDLTSEAKSAIASYVVEFHNAHY